MNGPPCPSTNGGTVMPANGRGADEHVIDSGIPVFDRTRQEVGMFTGRTSDGLVRRLLPALLLSLVLGVSGARAQLSPGMTMIMKGLVHYDSARYDSAIAALTEARQHASRYAESTLVDFYLAFAHIKSGDTAGGTALFSGILLRSPDQKLLEGKEEFAGIYEEARSAVGGQMLRETDNLTPRAARRYPLQAEWRQTDTVYVEPARTVRAGPRGRDYLVGASAGAVLGLASYFASVQFDNMALDKLKAHTLEGDSVDAAGLKAKAAQYHALGDVFQYASYPLAAIGFYVGLRLSARAIPAVSAAMNESSPTRIYCSLDKDFDLSLGVRRSIW